MRIDRIQVEARKSIMLSATGDATFTVGLEVSLEPHENTPEQVQHITQSLQATANWLVDQEMAKHKRG